MWGGRGWCRAGAEESVTADVTSTRIAAQDTQESRNEKRGNEQQEENKKKGCEGTVSLRFVWNAPVL